MTIPATLVTGSSAALREAAIAAMLAPGEPAALILDGLPTGADLFTDRSELRIARIAPGCVCCTGNLTLRVTLNRMLRQQPSRLFIGVASTEHLPAILDFLRQPPYDAWMDVGAPLSAD